MDNSIPIIKPISINNIYEVPIIKPIIVKDLTPIKLFDVSKEESVTKSPVIITKEIPVTKPQLVIPKEVPVPKESIIILNTVPSPVINNSIIKSEYTVLTPIPAPVKTVKTVKTPAQLIVKTIVLLGSQYRCPSIIYKLKLPDFKKIWLPSRTESYAKQMLNEECIEYNITLTKEELKSVSIMHLNDDEYDKLLINSYVIINQFNSSANNALLECIALNIPVFCNRLPAVEEYIGKDYPLFYRDIDHLEKMIYDSDKIKKAHQYLLNMTELKKKLELDRFIHDILNSSITRSILR